MIRWLRIAAFGVTILAMIALGGGVGLFLFANRTWVPVQVPDWLDTLFGTAKDVWLPALMAGWLVAILAGGTLVIWSMYYVYRRRQYEALIARLERELVRLRNLPFTDPAPLEDLPERPSAEAARLLAAAEVDDGASAGRGR